MTIVLPALSQHRWRAGVRFDADSGWELQAIGTAGYAQRLTSGLSWEVGASYASFSTSRDYDFGEVFVGLASPRLGARLFYSPDYYRQGAPGTYLEIDANRPLTERVSLQAHLGILRVDPWRRMASCARFTQYDLRLGLELSWRDMLVGIAWLDGTHRGLFRDSADLSGAGTALEVTLVRPF